MTTVLLAVDDTPEALAAAERAHALFGADADYLAVNVAEVQPAWTGAPMRWGAVYPYPIAAPYPLVDEEVAGRQTSDAVDRAREAAHDVADEAGIAAAAVGEVGEPTIAILAAAEEHRADVIVTGTTDKGWWRRLVDPSVSRGLVRESAVPVLVVPSARESG